MEPFCHEAPPSFLPPPLTDETAENALPSHLKDSVTVLRNVIQTTNNPYVLGLGEVISTLVQVNSHFIRIVSLPMLICITLDTRCMITTLSAVIKITLYASFVSFRQL